MDTFVESSWYFLRYCSPHCDSTIFNRDDVDYWSPVDQYIGGIEHAVMHLLYARFFTKVLRDLGYIGFDEPVTKLLTQGMVCKETYRCPNHGWLYPNEVKDGHCTKCGRPITVGRVEKMSKSKHNVVDPDELLNTYGADTLRLFSLFAAPPEKEIEWSQSGVEGCYRFVNRVFRIVYDNLELLNSDIPTVNEPVDAKSGEILRYTHTAIKKVTHDIERFQLNTAVAYIMEFVNNLYSLNELSESAKGAFKGALTTLIKLLSPFTPHLSEELWALAGFDGFVSRSQWPVFIETLIVEEDIKIVVQINGKVRAELSFKRGATEDEVMAAVFANERVKSYTDGKQILKKVYVTGKLVSLAVK
jgi:leucyl-tRNA synthetase